MRLVRSEFRVPGSKSRVKAGADWDLKVSCSDIET